MRRSHLLLVVAAVVLTGTIAFAQQPMAPYGDEPTPPPMAAPIPPAPPVVVVPAPTPPPLVVPPPGGYYQAPYGQQGYYYQQPCPVAPRSFHEEMHPNYGLMVAGLVIFGASWSINAATAYVADEWKLAVPIVGPFMETQNVSTGDSDADRMLVGLLVFDGLIETAGAVMLVAGAITHHKVRVYDSPRLSLTVTPTAGPTGSGLAAFGRF
jgi:hypothetical protein